MKEKNVGNNVGRLEHFSADEHQYFLRNTTACVADTLLASFHAETTEHVDTAPTRYQVLSDAALSEILRFGIPK